ncbi:hypothetical protein I79_016999 [Cricetulus griseus]|uniref:Uncharacterized protein n=1 Tax=Cricetulus griseus TaxID=10029 RepID=G3I0V8_CRIGR|nr:hypothetical protein I79_016999 [Cricetulus griseus]
MVHLAKKKMRNLTCKKVLFWFGFSKVTLTKPFLRGLSASKAGGTSKAGASTPLCDFVGVNVVHSMENLTLLKFITGGIPCLLRNQLVYKNLRTLGFLCF